MISSQNTIAVSVICDLGFPERRAISTCVLKRKTKSSSTDFNDLIDKVCIACAFAIFSLKTDYFITGVAYDFNHG